MEPAVFFVYDWWSMPFDVSSVLSLQSNFSDRSNLLIDTIHYETSRRSRPTLAYGKQRHGPEGSVLHVVVDDECHANERHVRHNPQAGYHSFESS